MPFVVAIITCGRIAPCFGPAVAGFIERYHDVADPERKVRLLAYRHGFRGILRGDVFEMGAEELKAARLLYQRGGSPIGASRTRLTNVEHLLKRGLLHEGEDPFDVAARQLFKDNVDVLHIIGSGHAQQTGERLSILLKERFRHTLRIVGLAKTIENDMNPIRMTMGAQTAAEQGATFFENVVPEHNSNSRMLIIHEIKGRAAGWLAASTAYEYRKRLDQRRFAASLGQSREVFEIHAVYTPEMNIDLAAEIGRLRRCMDRHDNVNIFVAQGTAQQAIEEESAVGKQVVERHPHLGYPTLDTAGWFAKKLKDGIGAEKVLIQRSGIYVRAAQASFRDLHLIQSCVNYAVDVALNGETNNGVVGHDDRHGGRLRLIEIDALGRKPFDLATPWFVELLAAIGQPQELQRRGTPLFVSPTAYYGSGSGPAKVTAGARAFISKL